MADGLVDAGTAAPDELRDDRFLEVDKGDVVAKLNAERRDPMPVTFAASLL